MKVYIIGSVGSGKTTLGRKLSLYHGIPHIETDNLTWQRHRGGDIRRTVERRNELLQSELDADCWLIEGVHLGWTDPVLQQADFIIFLDPPYIVRSMRVTVRFFKQILHLEQANYKPDWPTLGKMHKWNKYFEQVMKPDLLMKLEKFPGKVKVVRSRKDVKGVVAEVATYMKRIGYTESGQ